MSLVVDSKMSKTPELPNGLKHGVGKVMKRNGQVQSFTSVKIEARIKSLCFGLHASINPRFITDRVLANLRDMPIIQASELDRIARDVAIDQMITHPDYGVLAARLVTSDLHKSTKKKFSAVAKLLYENTCDGIPAPLWNEANYKFIQENADALDGAIIHAKDNGFSWFALQTLLNNGYLLRVGNKPVERCQHFLMRTAVSLWQPKMDMILECYRRLSDMQMIFATPTLQQNGKDMANLSSCFLLTMKDDSIPGIFETLGDVAKISKCSGGIGLSVSSIRAQGSYIRGSNGFSHGLVPFLKLFNDTGLAVNQAGKRPGAIAIYIEPWHADIFEVLECKRNQGNADTRCRSLFLAIWLNDLFMKRVESEGMWSLMCPKQCPGLQDLYGPKFDALYLKYESEKKYMRQVPAVQLWETIVSLQMETGNPYLLSKEACNFKSNHKHLGTIRSSNLCTEIVQFSSPGEVACCNLGSISLPAFVEDGKDGKKVYNYEKLRQTASFMAKSLDRVIDVTHYPIPEAKLSNLKHRPIAIGVQGLTDAMIAMRLPYESDEAGRLDEDIFETIYYGACQASLELAQETGPYETFAGSPMSQGLFQFDLWNEKPKSGRWDWDSLRKEIVKHGMRNSLLVGPMPTASTSQILGNTESFEIAKSNVFVRRTQSGEFIVSRASLVKDLQAAGLWSPTMSNLLIAQRGKVQQIPQIPSELKALYKVNSEIPIKLQIDRGIARAKFIDQSQSMNEEVADPTLKKLTAMHFYSWKKGAKTLVYYTHRADPAVNAIAFTVDKTLLAQTIGSAANTGAEDTDEENDEEPDLDVKDQKTDSMTFAADVAAAVYSSASMFPDLKLNAASAAAIAGATAATAAALADIAPACATIVAAAPGDLKAALAALAAAQDKVDAVQCVSCSG